MKLNLRVANEYNKKEGMREEQQENKKCPLVEMIRTFVAGIAQEILIRQFVNQSWKNE